MSVLVKRLRNSIATEMNDHSSPKMSDLRKRYSDRIESMIDAADRIEALEGLLEEVINALQWYVDEDDVREGGMWDTENAPWIEGKRTAESVIDKTKNLLKE